MGGENTLGGFFRMKTKRTLWRAIGASAIIALIGFGVAGCDNGNSVTIHTVTFNTHGGSDVQSQAVEEGQRATMPAPPTRADHNFVGWFTAEAGGTAFNFNTPITGPTTIHARWEPVQQTPDTHTVTFNLGGGTWDAELKVQVQDNDTVDQPMVVPTKPGYAFAGWYTAATDGTAFDFDEPITQNTTIYARWLDAASVPGANLAAQLTWLQNNAQTGGEYVIQLTGDISSAPNTLAFGTRSFTIILRGVGEMRTVSVSSDGSLFTIGSSVTLVLDNNVTLQGRTGNNSALVQVDAGGTFVMNEGSRVTGNTNASGSAGGGGGGVRVVGGLFAMYCGEISNNASYYFGGGGVQITGENGIFRMHGGTISGNTGTVGGGVHVNSNLSIFEMRGGTISSNTATAASGGGGVRNFGVFRFSGGTIHGNEAEVAEGLRNMASYGAALSNNAATATAQRGTFNADEEFTASSNLDTTNFTIHE